MTECPMGGTTVGHALHALEPGEEQKVAEHLPTCASCRELLREARAVTTLLASAVPAVAPPAALRERVLAEATSGATARPAAGLPDRSGTTGAGPSRPGTGAPARGGSARPGTDRSGADRSGADRSGPGRSRPGAARGRGAGRRTRRWALGAVAAVVLGVVLVSVRLPGSAPDPSVTVAQQAQQIVRDAEARDPAGQQATLRGADGSPVGVVLADAGATRLVPLGLAPAGTGRSYVLWRVAGQAPVAVGVLDADGATVPVPASPGPSDGPTTAYAVSVEPAGTVPARPSTVVADGAVV